MASRRSGEVPALPYSAKLAGSPRRLSWPSLCASCGAEATERLPITRVDDRDWRLPQAYYSIDYFRIYAVTTIDVPFCSACAARHHREARPVGLARSVLSLFRTPFVLPLLVAIIAFSFYVAPQVLGPLGAVMPAPSTALPAAVFGAAAAGFALVVWYQTRHLRVPSPTTVTRAFDFSDNLGGLVGVAHRVYGMENERFAQAFTRANTDRVWTTELAARTARREAVAAAVAAGVVLAAVALALIAR